MIQDQKLGNQNSVSSSKKSHWAHEMRTKQGLSMVSTDFEKLKTQNFEIYRQKLQTGMEKFDIFQKTVCQQNFCAHHS